MGEVEGFVDCYLCSIEVKMQEEGFIPRTWTFFSLQMLAYLSKIAASQSPPIKFSLIPGISTCTVNCGQL